VEEHVRKQTAVFGGAKINSLSKDDRLEQVAALAPVLRGFAHRIPA